MANRARTSGFIYRSGFARSVRIGSLLPWPSPTAPSRTWSLTQSGEIRARSVITGIMNIVDLTVPIGTDTYSPPSVNQPIRIEQYHKEPGFWMVSEITMMLHAGSHGLHEALHRRWGNRRENPPRPHLWRSSPDRSHPIEPDHDITPEDLAAAAPEIRPGDIVLVRPAGPMWPGAISSLLRWLACM